MDLGILGPLPMELETAAAAIPAPSALREAESSRSPSLSLDEEHGHDLAGENANPFAKMASTSATVVARHPTDGPAFVAAVRSLPFLVQVYAAASHPMLCPELRFDDDGVLELHEQTPPSAVFTTLFTRHDSFRRRCNEHGFTKPKGRSSLVHDNFSADITPADELALYHRQLARRAKRRNRARNRARCRASTPSSPNSGEILALNDGFNSLKRRCSEVATGMATKRARLLNFNAATDKLAADLAAHRKKTNALLASVNALAAAVLPHRTLA